MYRMDEGVDAVGGWENDDSKGPRADLREHLARELHDTVASQLQAMLVEMELLRRDGKAPPEIERFQAETRQALGNLRALLYRLRAQSEPQEVIRELIELRVSAALEMRGVRRRRSSSAQV